MMIHGTGADIFSGRYSHALIFVSLIWKLTSLLDRGGFAFPCLVICEFFLEVALALKG